MTAAETRKMHDEARKEKEQETNRIREKLQECCLSLLDDMYITPKERLEVAKMLFMLTKGRL